jgi:diadenosine tetraphosphate (Ap4A) HIT family hydrolase
MNCELCEGGAGEVLWSSDLCRVVLVDEPDYPGYCRVILNRHAKEMTDLKAGEREALMEVVFAVEQALRDVLAPDKINLASLGNQIPHLHWHVIPRWRSDRHFPAAVWAQPRRASRPLVPTAWRERLASVLTARLPRHP